MWTATLIFKDPMTTAAAIDRLVHHSVIVELNIPIYTPAVSQQKRDANAMVVQMMLPAGKKKLQHLYDRLPHGF
jgi:hypothetical protein